VYDAPSSVSIDQLFVDNGHVLALWDDMQNVGLTLIGSPVPVFTTPIAGGLGAFTGLPVAVVEAAGNAFYVSQGALHAVSISSGTDQVLGMPGNCIPMFADATAVFCALDGMVLSFSSQGTMRMVTDLSPAKADGMYADASTLYITAHTTNYLGKDLWSAPRAGGTATMLVTADAQEGGFFFFPGQMDDANLYLGVGGGIARMSKATGQIAIVFQNGDASSGSCFGDPNIAGDYFYYSCGGTLTRGLLASGKTMDLLDTIADTLGTDSLDGLDSMVVANGAAYWVSFLQDPNPQVVIGHEAVMRWPLPP
jgi:hypothetical protein